jgi:hypothetical protein
VADEATQAVGDADPGAEDEDCTLIKHIAGEAKRCHRVLHWMLDEHPYLALQLSMFYRHAQRGIPPGGKFVGRVSLRLGTQRCKEHKV